MTYITLFLIVGILLYISEHQKVKNIKIIGFYNNKTLFYHSQKRIAFLGLILLSSVAALRDSDVGTDVMTYVLPIFYKVSGEHSLSEVVQNAHVEVGYELLAFISSRIVNDVHLFHFLSAFIISGGIFTFLYEFKSKISLALGMLVFMLVYYNTSFNAVRQFMATAIILCSYRFIYKNQYFKYIIMIFFATFIHNSAYIAFFILLIYLFLRNENDCGKRILFVIIGTLIIIFFLEDIVLLLRNLGILRSKYINYFSGTGISSFFMQAVIRLPVLLLGAIYYKDLWTYDKRNIFIYCMMIIDFFLGCTAPVIGFASRISMYFGIWQCILIPELYVIIKQRVKGFNQILVSLGFITYLAAYWIYRIVIRNFGYTFPYKSDIISNLF